MQQNNVWSVNLDQLNLLSNSGLLKTRNLNALIKLLLFLFLHWAGWVMFPAKIDTFHPRKAVTGSECLNLVGTEMSADTKIAELLTELHQLIKQTQVS